MSRIVPAWSTDEFHWHVGIFGDVSIPTTYHQHSSSAPYTFTLLLPPSPHTQISDDDDSKADRPSPRFQKNSKDSQLLLQTSLVQGASYRFTPTGAILLSGFEAPIPQSGLAAAAAAEEQEEARAQAAALTNDESQLSAYNESPAGCSVSGDVVTPMQDRVVLLDKLGEGATGVVYRAFDLLDLRLVAVKVIPVYDQSKRRQLVHELSSFYDGLKARRRRSKSVVTHEVPGEGGSLPSHLGLVPVAAPATASRHHCWLAVGEEAGRIMPTPDAATLAGSKNLLDFIDVFVNKEASTLSLVVEYMDGGSLQVYRNNWRSTTALFSPQVSSVRDSDDRSLVRSPRMDPYLPIT